MWLTIVALAPVFAPAPGAQELDAVLLRERPAPQRSTVIGQVNDPKERRAFLKLYELHDARKRRDQANEFLARYPRSWLLAEVFEIAAKASIDLKDYAAAMRFGAQSLQLFPENPLLLVPLANVEAEEGKLASAQESARNAIEYLDRFDRPASVAAEDWPRVRSELKASAYYALGRSEIAAALGGPGEHRRRGLIEAEDALIRARESNPQDPETAYLLGLTELSLGNELRAAFYFAKARRAGGAVGVRALTDLRHIYEARKEAAPFEEFVARSERQDEATVAVDRPDARAMPVSANSYAGSAACEPCHAEAYRAWQRSGMGRMFRAAQEENIIGDFRSNNHFDSADGTPLARMTIRHGTGYFTIRERGGNWATYPVDFTIGSKWQQAYATKRPDGDIQVFPIQYNTLTKHWVNYWKMIDPAGAPRGDVQNFGTFTAATSYQLNCAPCHTSQLRATPGASTEAHGFEFREGGINCEMCHGPGAAHVRAMSSARDRAAMVDFEKISADRFVSICAQCHAQSALRELGSGGEVNLPSDGAAFPPVYLSRPYTDISRRAFYKDGRFRETTFIVEAFRRSACFRKGNAHCGFCHQPHAPQDSPNLTSLKFPNDPDRMCLQCHSKFSANPAAHTHHATASEASRCVSCHMPRIMNSLLFQARTHRIDDIPNAAMTQRFGAEESPNACALCHADKDAGWVAASLKAW